jgi:hypothetical protein
MLRRSNDVLICKCGAYSLMPARTYAKRVVAAASFYGTRLATDTPNIATEEADGLENEAFPPLVVRIQ